MSTNPVQLFRRGASNARAFAARSQCAAVLLLTLASPFALAAEPTSTAAGRYQTERAACMNGQSNQDRETCLKEAGAAMDESKRGQLGNGETASEANAMQRCNALPGDQREACMMRMEGAGTVSGSAREGGVLRELTVPDKK
jgi:hypothetical protein